MCIALMCKKSEASLYHIPEGDDEVHAWYYDYYRIYGGGGDIPPGGGVPRYSDISNSDISGIISLMLPSRYRQHFLLNIFKLKQAVNTYPIT